MSSTSMQHLELVVWTPQDLWQTLLQGMLAFGRLVGCAYFKKHISGFKCDTPEVLFHSIPTTDTEQQHEQWLDVIRKTVWERRFDKCHYVPSYEALGYDVHGLFTTGVKQQRIIYKCQVSIKRHTLLTVCTGF